MKAFVVKYIGNDRRYWEKIQNKFGDFSSSIKPIFEQEHVDGNFHPPASFIDTYQKDCDIVYVDLSVEPLKCLSLCKLLCRNNVTRLKAVVALHQFQDGQKSLLKGALAGVRLNHYKGMEVDEVVFHPLSLLDPSLKSVNEYATGKSIPELVYKQILRIGYIADDHFRVETSSPLAPDKIVELEDHPLGRLMDSSRFFVENFSDSDLYYNQRYSYNLKHTFVDSEFFRASESSWLTYKKLKESQEDLKGDAQKSFEFVLEDLEKRKSELAPIRKRVKKWIEENESDVVPKRLKVLVVDETLEIFKEFDGKIDQFKFTINFQTKLTHDFYQIRRSKPHLILFHYEKQGNNENVLSQVVKQIRRFEDYNPVVLVFNYHDNSVVLKNLHDYQNIIAYKNTIHLDAIKELSQTLDQRLRISESQGKVYLKTSDPRSVASVKRYGKILRINESEMYFQTKYEIPMWTTFSVEKPANMLITVLPFNEQLSFEASPNIYRALINGVDDLEKARLRQLVNKSL
ncbi:MAG: hypothetical protein WD025_02130 [Bacteriovoracaceae bacterium]